MLVSVVSLPARQAGPSLPGKYLENPFQIGASLWSVDLLHTDTATAVGDNGLIKHSLDAGQTWTRVPSGGSTDILLSVDAIDSNHSVAVGHGGAMLRTTNAGASWDSIPRPTAQSLFAVAFSSPEIGVAVGSEGVIFRTSDGGGTWSRQDSGKAAFLLGMAFAGPSVGVAVGSSGTILRSTDGGLTWVAQQSGVTNYLYGVSFVTPDNGYVVGTQGLILHTSDGGSHWASQSSGTTKYLFGVSIHSDTGAAVGEVGTLLVTTDGGNRWVSRPTGTAQNLYSVALSDNFSGVAVGAGGAIVRIQDTTITVTGLAEDAGAAPGGFELLQNYPNPFNPVTMVSFVIGHSSFVSLTVYNLLGQEVATLVNEAKRPGEYQVRWDARGMPSGVYFYRLQAGTLTQTKKLVLLR